MTSENSHTVVTGFTENACDEFAGDILADKVELWRDRLLDLGNRNALINTRFSERSTTIEFDTPTTEEIWEKLAAESEAGADPMRFPWRRDLVPPPPDWQEYEDEEDDVAVNGQVGQIPTIRKRKRREWNPRLEECRQSSLLQSNDLLVDKTDKVLDRKLRNLDDHAKLAMSEQGVHVLYVAFGFLKWFESVDSAEERFSPLMLVPVTLSRDSTSAPWELTEAEDEAVDNLCLRQRLWQDFKLELPALPEINELEEEGARLTFLEAVRHAVEKHERWEVVDKCVIGRFAFPKIAMWKDLGDHKASVIEHSLCRALGGDEKVIGVESFGPVDDVPPSKELDDKVLPGEVKSILDCDSSQLEAIVAARKGVSFVLDGPPGTGKSQTIANIIADALSVGRTVLFVSEKISALEVVKQRLEDRQLDDFCLECHSDKANRRAVLFELERCLNLPAEVYQDTSPKLDELADQRSQLNDYVRRIHEPRDPLGLSAFELFGRVSRLTSQGLAQLTRCRLPNLVEADRATFDRWMRLLGRAVDVEAVILEHDEHPWRGCKQTGRSLSIHDDIKHHFGTITDRLGRVSDLFALLVSRNLLEPVLAENLSDTLKAFEKALASPKTPRVWFESPAETAKAVVCLLTAQATQATIFGELDRLIDDVEQVFSVEAARAIASGDDDVPTSSVRGFLTPSARTVRERLSEVTTELERLAPVAGALSQLETSTEEYARGTGLAAESSLRVEQLGQLGRATRLAGAAGPARQAWLNPTRCKSIQSLAEKALTFVDKNKTLAEQLSDVVTREQIPTLAEQIARHGDLTERLSSVASQGVTDRNGLNAAQTILTEARELVGCVLQASTQLAEALGRPVSDREVSLPTELPDQLCDMLRKVEQAGVLCGSWRDSSVRDRVKRACDDAVGDLSDAETVREFMSDRLSHRAFRDSARNLVSRGTAYSSAFKRWFGGFGAFRTEVADLYSGGVPKGAEVVADMTTLQKFHQRIRDVEDAAEELKSHLPQDFVAGEVSSWERIKAGVTTLDELTAIWPDLVGEIRDGTRTMTSGQLTGPGESLVAATRKYNALMSESNIDLPSFDGGVVDVLQVVDDQTTRIESCDATWNEVDVLTLRPVLSVTGLGQLVAAVTKFMKRHVELQAASEKYSDWMPEDADPTSAAPWQSMQDGVTAAEIFRDVCDDLGVIQSKWCTSAFRQEAAVWAAAGSSLENAAAEAQKAVETAALDFVITPAHQAISEVGNATGRMTAQQKHLSTLSDTIRLDEDITIDELAGLADRITELRETRAAIEQANHTLDGLGITGVSSDDLEAATWLAETVATDSLNPLVQAVASDEETREQIGKAFDEGKAILDNAGFREGWSFLKTLFELSEEISDGFVISETPLGELGEKLRWLVTQLPRFDDWLKFAGWKLDVTEAGFGAVVDELIAGRYEAKDTADVVAVQFYRQLFDHLAETDRAIGHFDVDEHERVRERFRFLDQWEVKASASRIRQYQLGRDDRPSSNFLGAESSELGILQKEIAKKRKHKPLRRLFSEIPTVLQRLKPCIMMSPLSVSTFLETDDIQFDLVIFDEASQVFPWDALGAIYRGSQLIVAGDDKQLPPTNFFNRADAESDDDEEDIGDYESILSLCKSIGMPNQRLRWHYRSRREPLIAFSNRHFYDGELVTFPSVHADSGVRLEHVPEGRWVERKNITEAQRVVDMIVEHVQKRPDKSLGVIALNQSHQRAIEDALYDLKRERREIDALFDGGNYFGSVDEPLFIKNLENVQGDERDVIYISMGYGFNDAGKFNKNFGPINKQNGERRLNVAVTRAREELVFVSSVRAADMDLSGSKSEGAHLLKAYLNYAEKGVDTLGLVMDEFASEADSPFEEEVAAALIRRGLQPVPQVGCGGFRIDLALKHPDRPGEFCLAVECDGATYHSSHTARDRDRIRQTILENLGWRIVRIWSTDWIRDPDRQIDRVLGEYDAAVSMSPPRYTPSAQNDEEADDELGLEPQFIEKPSIPEKTPKYFGNIDDVPDQAIHIASHSILTQGGAMTLDDLVKLTSRELGFRRLGNKIKARLQDQFGMDLETGRLKKLGERVTTGCTSG